MVVMDYRDLLTEVSIFLRVTLAGEKLSEQAETFRQQLITRLITRERSPPQGSSSYIDMNGVTKCSKILHQNSDCYEEFDSFRSQVAEGYINTYNNLSAVCKENSFIKDENNTRNYINQKHQSHYEDNNMYINPSSPLANTPVIRKQSSPIPPSSNSNSKRNSLISLKKDSDRTSDTSSYSSSSTRGDESAEVVAKSAAVLRYAASWSGVLRRRERFLFVEHTKQCWVAVVHHSLYVFSTDQDNKPVAEIDISGYQARPVAISNNKTDFKFELIAPGNKTYQFIAEKQSEMDKWIGAINAAAKIEEPARQLPSPPPAMTLQETYDHPDSAVRPVIEAEYEVPDTVMRSHTVCDSWGKQLVMLQRVGGEVNRRNSEPRQLPSPPQQTYDSPEPGARRVSEVYESLMEELYHHIEDQPEPQKPKKPLRRLPSLPQEEETYDQPEPTIRPVAQEETSAQDEFYSVIENLSQPDIQEAIYNNPEDNSCIQDDDDNNYYNLMPSYPEKEKEQECIYNLVTEQRPMASPSPDNEPKKPPISAKPLFINSQPNQLTGKPKREEKKLSPFVSNMAEIFDRPFNQQQSREGKSSLANKTSL